MAAHALFCCQRRLRSRRVSFLLFLRSIFSSPFHLLNQTSPRVHQHVAAAVRGRWRRTLRQSRVVKRKSPLLGEPATLAGGALAASISKDCETVSPSCLSGGGGVSSRRLAVPLHTLSWPIAPSALGKRDLHICRLRAPWLKESSRLPGTTENDHLLGTKPRDGPKGGAASLSFLWRQFPASLGAYLRPGSKAAAFMT